MWTSKCKYFGDAYKQCCATIVNIMASTFPTVHAGGNRFFDMVNLEQKVTHLLEIKTRMFKLNINLMR